MGTQLVHPRLTTQSKAGWCLWFQEEDFGTPHLYQYAEDEDPTTTDAWSLAQFKHPGEQPPEDVCVPVYFSFFSVQDGREEGHIADHVPGRGVFSSPLDSSYGNQWFPSIQALVDRINKIKGANCRYLGYSEDLAGVRIVEINMDAHPYNEGDATNISVLTGYPLETMKGKVDWNDAYYSTVQPEFVKLQRRIDELMKTNCTPDERAYLDAMYKLKKG